MSVSFANLVLNPCMLVLSIPITVDPRYSRPGEAPYEARGIFSSTPLHIQTLEGVQLSDQSTTLGIRLADFEGKTPPHPRDFITVRGQQYFVSDFTEDGQGGANLQLRLLTPSSDLHPTIEPDVT